MTGHLRGFFVHVFLINSLFSQLIPEVTIGMIWLATSEHPIVNAINYCYIFTMV